MHSVYVKSRFLEKIFSSFHIGFYVNLYNPLNFDLFFLSYLWNGKSYKKNLRGNFKKGLFQKNSMEIKGYTEWSRMILHNVLHWKERSTSVY